MWFQRAPAPPLATTGTATRVRLTRRVIMRSKPCFVPSASMEFNTNLARAERPTARLAHSSASRPVSLRATGAKNTPHLSGRAIFLASIETNDALAAELLRAFADEVRPRGARRTLMEILSAPARSMVNMSSHGLDAAADR